MSRLSPSATDDLGESVGVGSVELELGGVLSEEEDLNGRSGGVCSVEEGQLSPREATLIDHAYTTKVPRFQTCKRQPSSGEG